MALTDANGVVVFSGVKTGDHSIIASKLGFISNGATCVVAEGEQTEVTIYLTRHRPGVGDPRLNMEGAVGSAQLNMGG